MKRHPLVGVAVIIKKENNVLLGKRKNAHGHGTWAFPGGHLEWMESIETCAEREVLEETGLTIQNVQFAAVTNDFFTKEDKHYITLFVTADYISGRPQVKEPDKCEQWEWFAWSNLPRPRFTALENLIKQGYSV